MSFVACIRMLLVVSTLLAAAVGSAAAQSSSDGWRFEATPYLWLTGIGVESRLRDGPDIKSHLTASEVLEKLDLAAMGAFEARQGRWGIVLDALHARLSDAGTATRVVSGVPVTVAGDVRVRQTVFTLGGLYRVSEGARPVDVEAGLRYQRLDVRADLSASALGQLLVTANPDFGRRWVDPYVGLRARMTLAPQWSVFGQADVGGFGVGSKFSLQGIAGLIYDINQTYAARLGWRHLHVNYDRDGFRNISNTSGLFAGVTIRL